MKGNNKKYLYKVSVIVPIYNSAGYMRKCIDSILASTLQEIELILVDDCSTDNSVSVMREYAEREPTKVKLLFQPENKRQGAARNEGIKNAQGEYFAFVDSDDFIEPVMLEKLYVAAKEENADCCGGDFYYSKESEEQEVRVQYTSFSAKNQPSKHDEYLHGYGMFWTRIYKKDFLISHNLYFPERLFYEDAYFNFFGALLAERVVKVDECFYHYVVREGSTVCRRNNSTLYDKIQIANLTFDNCESHKSNYTKQSPEIQERFLSLHIAALLYTCLGQFDEPSIVKMQEIKDSILARMPKYKKCEGYKRLNREYKWWLKQLMRSPKRAIWCYRHNVWGYITAIRRKLGKKD